MYSILRKFKLTNVCIIGFPRELQIYALNMLVLTQQGFLPSVALLVLTLLGWLCAYWLPPRKYEDGLLSAAKLGAHCCRLGLCCCRLLRVSAALPGCRRRPWLCVCTSLYGLVCSDGERLYWVTAVIGNVYKPTQISFDKICTCRGL